MHSPLVEVSLATETFLWIVFVCFLVLYLIDTGLAAFAIYRVSSV